MASPVQISINQLSRLVGTPAASVIIDVRTDEDFSDDPRLIPASIRYPYHEITENIDLVIDRVGSAHSLVYCQKGLKISEGVASSVSLLLFVVQILTSLRWHRSAQV